MAPETLSPSRARYCSVLAEQLLATALFIARRSCCGCRRLRAAVASCRPRPADRQRALNR